MNGLEIKINKNPVSKKKKHQLNQKLTTQKQTTDIWKIISISSIKLEI